MKKLLLSFVFSFLLCNTNIFSQEKLYPNTFPLGDVKLLDGPFKHACDLNTNVLLSYDTERLLAPFLKEAGLTKKAHSFSNWIDLDGHVGGHYLSALAIHYAATGNEACKTRMEYMLSELKRCQNAHTQAGNAGYVGGVPNGLSNIWSKVKAGTPTAVASGWVPWYNIHKTYAGLRDAWLYGGIEDARQMFLDLCDWGLTIISPLSDAQMESMLATEFGGMNEVYADAYQMTGEVKYLNAAKRFSHKTLFNSMSARTDNLDNMHANTQVPKAVGYQRVAELSKENNYITASGFFWETVVNKRSLSIGGNSRREHFPTASSCSEYVEEREGPESCNTNNMLKLTEGLFRMNPQAKYADYYERAMFNHILSTQHPEHGGYVYFTPARPRHYRVYSDVNKAMWCCVGTGMENHGKYGEFIYSHTTDSLFVNLFVASELTWKDKNVTITQETEFPSEEGTTLKIKTNGAATPFSLLIRYPSWVAAGELKITINGVDYAVTSTPSSYVEIDRTWNTGDIVTVKTPMRVTIEELPNVANYISILKGPIVLGARTGTEDLHGLVADEDRWAHIAAGSLLSVTEAPFIVGERAEVLQKLNSMKPVEGKPFSFNASDLFVRQSDKALILEPFYQIHDSRYMMYWLSMTKREYEMTKDKLEEQEYVKMVLDNRTIDDVKPGEQQPEVDHSYKTSNSYTGYHKGEGWRDARNGGYFSYNMLTAKREDLYLMVRYWGNEGGNRTFSIMIDGELLTTENVSGKWKVDEFVNVEYPIPASMLKDKESVIVRFQTSGTNVAGGVFRVRMLTPPPTKNDFKLSLQISRCEYLLFTAEKGTMPETYPESAFTALEEKIATAKTVKESNESTQEEVDKQEEKLKSAYHQFYASVNRKNDTVIHFSFAEDDSVVDVTNNNYTARLLNNAVTKLMGDYYVAALGSGNGYIDMGQQVGTAIHSLNDFSISTYICVDNSTAITGSGNYLWCFSSHSTCTSLVGQYMSFRVNKQRYAISTGGISNEAGALELGSAIVKGKWHHVFYTQYASVGRLYINGKLVQETPVYYGPSDIVAPTYNWIGRPHISGNVYLKNTFIYDFKVYNRTLTETEIGELAQVSQTLQTAYDAEVSVVNPSLDTAEIIGGKGEIQVKNVQSGGNLKIYNTVGQLVQNILIPSENMAVKIDAGTYVVNGQKVIVK